MRFETSFCWRTGMRPVRRKAPVGCGACGFAQTEGQVLEMPGPKCTHRAEGPVCTDEVGVHSDLRNVGAYKVLVLNERRFRALDEPWAKMVLRNALLNGVPVFCIHGRGKRTLYMSPDFPGRAVVHENFGRDVHIIDQIPAGA